MKTYQLIVTIAALATNLTASSICGMPKPLEDSACAVSQRISADRAPTLYDVRDYGAVTDTTVLSAEAIQRAIDACHQAGGGTVTVPPGDYKISTILLKDNVELLLEAGATLYASRNVDDYKGKKIAMGAADMDEAEVMVLALYASNISVTGKGRLHARAVREMYRRKPQLSVTDSVTGREIDNAIKYGVDYQSKYRKVAPCPGIINFTGCNNATIRDISVVESSGWGVHLQWCRRVVVSGVNILSDGDNGVNSDGLDIDGCSDVTVSDCMVNTGDDGICLKTTLTSGETHPCRNITVTNCILTSSSAAFKLGTESHADFENITVDNCIISDANRGLNMIIRDGANVRNVIFSNIIINTVRKATFWWGNGDPVWLTIQARRTPYAGSIENVMFSNIIAHGQSGVRIEGFDGEISNVRFNNFQLFMCHEDAVDKRARDGFMFDKVKRLSLIDCEVIWDTGNPEPAWRHAYRFKDIDGLTLVRATGDPAPNGKYDDKVYDNVKWASAQ